MASIIQLADGDGEFGARLAGATYRLVREKGVMLAPVKVLHLPDPAGLATERLGPERTEALMAEGEAMAIEDVVAAVAAAPVPGQAPDGTGASWGGFSSSASSRRIPDTTCRGRPSPGCWASWMTVPAAPSTALGIAYTSPATSHWRSAPTHIGHGSRVVKIVTSERCGVRELARRLAQGDDDGVGGRVVAPRHAVGSARDHRLVHDGDRADRRRAPRGRPGEPPRGPRP